MAAGCAPGCRYRRNPLSLVTSAARGIAVHLGAKFSVLPSNHLRVATSTLTDRCDEVVDGIVLAAAH